MNSADITRAIKSHTFKFSSETELQNMIHKLLPDATREKKLDADRVDFFLDGVAVEVKVKGSAHDVLRQLQRYAQHEEVTEILLVTSRSMHQSLRNEKLNGKPVQVCYLDQNVF